MESGQLSYLGIDFKRPRAAFFELSSCEGCQLQLLNDEQYLIEFLNLVEIADFREIKSERSDVYDVAFIEGSITMPQQREFLRGVRKRAKTLVAFGTCAIFGGVNSIKNSDKNLVKSTGMSMPVSHAVTVDASIFGCPVDKSEAQRIIMDMVVGKPVVHPAYPVCMECKANENICVFELGEPCLGPITRAGCGSACTNSGTGCWGCRGPADDPNIEEMGHIMRKHGFGTREFLQRMGCFGGFSGLIDSYKKKAGR